MAPCDVWSAHFRNPLTDWCKKYIIKTHVLKYNHKFHNHLEHHSIHVNGAEQNPKDAILFLRIKWRYSGVRACSLKGDLMADVQLLLHRRSVSARIGRHNVGEELPIAANQISNWELESGCHGQPLHFY